MILKNVSLTKSPKVISHVCLLLNFRTQQLFRFGQDYKVYNQKSEIQLINYQLSDLNDLSYVIIHQPSHMSTTESLVSTFFQ